MNESLRRFPVTRQRHVTNEDVLGCAHVVLRPVICLFQFYICVFENFNLFTIFSAFYDFFSKYPNGILGVPLRCELYDIIFTVQVTVFDAFMRDIHRI